MLEKWKGGIIILCSNSSADYNLKLHISKNKSPKYCTHYFCNLVEMSLHKECCDDCLAVVAEGVLTRM